MIIQAIGLFDDLDKELNTYTMRVREWYGWHFPELAKIVQDNIQYGGIDQEVKLKKDKEKKKKKVVVGDEGKNCRSERTTTLL